MNISIAHEKLSLFCRKNSIRKLSFFGSVLREDFLPNSDIDVLVEFKAGMAPGFIRLSSMERELSGLLGSRKVDLRTPQELSKYFRDEVKETAAVQYEEN